MGVPHLITYLRPFSTSIDFSGQSAVIDGPALAYHVWYICLSFRPEARNPFEASPSYKILGETAIRWLDDLQAHSVCLKKIFFDGLLPDSKRPTRINRISGYTKQLNDYNQAWPQMIPSSQLEESSNNPDVKSFNIGNPPANFTRLPAAPFLVPAVIEALYQCERYADLTEVVPGEADLYCADYVKVHGGIIITADSDLLLHDLGDGSVCFFKDIELTTLASGTSLTCIEFQVEAIAKRLGLEKGHGLLALAFEMTKDTHANFRELLQRAMKLKAVSTYGPCYESFVYEYKALHDKTNPQEISKTEALLPSLSLSCQFKNIDPRTSEYLFQFLHISQAAGLPRSLHTRFFNHHSHIDVFLPFLLDCPLRTSAWEMSTTIRQLAYGLVNLALPQEESILKVREYRRLQNSSQGREWEVPNIRNLPKACTDLHQLLEKVKHSMPLQLQERLWHAFAIYQDQEFNLGSVKPALSTILINQPEGNKLSHFRLTWDAIHLYAQFQGSYYSFRILKQILSVILLCLENTSVSLVLHQLHTTLRSLPTLDELPTVVDAMQDIGSSDNRFMLKMVQGLLGIQPLAEVTRIRKSKNRKRRNAGDLSRASNSAESTNCQIEHNNQGDGKDLAKAKFQPKETNNIFNHLCTE